MRCHGGQACIRDIRVPVSLIVNLIANGASFSDIITDYEYLEEEDIKQALKYASWTASDKDMDRGEGCVICMTDEVSRITETGMAVGFRYI